MNWLKELKIKVRFKEPLRRHTTLRVGGKALAWAEPRDQEELRQLILHCRQRRLPYFIIGKGSNILVGERGFSGVVICLSSPLFTKVEFQDDCISAGAGLALSQLIERVRVLGLGGLEFLAGIPASLGGTLVMNAGSQQQNIGDLVETVTVMDRNGWIKTLSRNELKFGYRQSNLNRYIVLAARLRLIKKDPEAITGEIAAILAKKRQTQDLAAKSAGCIFKNPEHPLTAGKMIEACGLKKRRQGGAEISPRHANYIVNRRGAKAGDILYLIALAQREVKKRFGVRLEPEIKIIK